MKKSTLFRVSSTSSASHVDPTLIPIRHEHRTGFTLRRDDLGEVMVWQKTQWSTSGFGQSRKTRKRGPNSTY